MKVRPLRLAGAEGFSLIEALVALALMGLVLGALATITAQWLPVWSRGFDRLQRNELVDLTLDRLVADLEAAEFVTAGRSVKSPLFDGRELSVMFVRSALGPNVKPGLQVVQIAQTADHLGSVLVRSQAQFVPREPPAPFSFTNSIPLLRAPYRISFAYAGRDGVWRNAWENESLLPKAVRLTVRDAASERVLNVSTTAKLHIDLPAACVHPQNNQDCAAFGLVGVSDAETGAAGAPNRQSGG